MYTRTLAVSLGELHRQPPSSAQCLRAASTAGALLAGYFPHLRGAFRFPQHLTGEGERNAQHRYPQIASLISAQEAAGVEGALERPGRLETPLAVPDSVKPENVDMETVRTSVVATLMAREYGPRMYRLEGKCLELRASNQQLQADLEAVQARFEKTRELNRRLCREVNEARTERSAAVEELERAEKRAEQRLQEVHEVRHENSALREALEVSEQKVLQLARIEPDVCVGSTEEMDIEETGPDPSVLMVPMDPELPLFIEADSWGCTSLADRVYSEHLLLAHRTIAARIANGPPGLELEVPPGLTRWDHSISMRPRL